MGTSRSHEPLRSGLVTVVHAAGWPTPMNFAIFQLPNIRFTTSKIQLTWIIRSLDESGNGVSLLQFPHENPGNRIRICDPASFSIGKGKEIR